ncbi:MAG: acyl carrier protein, partial [Desulfobacteraceae bacterium]|nr:acyl carrier protein [Desulfobacteraceae bacterium]
QNRRKVEKSMKITIEQQIRSFIIENFLFGESGNDLKKTDSFLENGIIDSTGVLELISFIEETYDFQVEDEELIPENLDSIATVIAYVQRKSS